MEYSLVVLDAISSTARLSFMLVFCVSPPVDIIVTGDEVLVLEEKQNEKGVTRVRFAKGWLSVTASDGSVILEGVE